MINIQEISSKTGMRWIAIISALVLLAVAFLLAQSQTIQNYNPDIYILPKINAVLNSLTFLFLFAGLIFIKNGKKVLHQGSMITAFVLSSLFLVSYVIYHYQAPHTSYGGEGVIRYIYFGLLISHILLATTIVPLALITVFRAVKMDYKKHKKIARWTLPIWLYVSLTGVIIYFLIAPYYPV